MITRVIMIQTYLFMLGCGLVMFGLFAGGDFLLQHEPALATVMLLPDSALLAMLLGAMLLGCLSRSAWWRLLPAICVVGLCIYSLVHSWLAGGHDQGVSLLSGFLRIRDGLAAVMLLPALALLASGTSGRLAARLAAVVLLAVCLLQALAMLGILTLPFWLGFKFSANLMAALVTGLTGVAMLAWSFLPSSSSLGLSRTSLVLGIATAFAAALTWHQLSQSNIRHLQASSDLLLDTAEQYIVRELDARKRLLQRMGERWETVDKLPADSVWLQESGSYLRDYDDLRFVAMLDTELHPALLRETAGMVTPTVGQLLARTEPATLWHQSHISAEQGRVFLEGRVDHYGLLAMPLRLQGQFWLLTAGVDLRGLLADAPSSPAQALVLRVEHAGQAINELPVEAAFLPVQTRSFELEHGEPWKLQTLVAREYAPGGGGGLAASEFGFLLLVGMLMMITQRMTSLAIYRNRLLRRLTGTLRSNMQRQAELHSFNEQIMRHSLDLLCALDSEGRVLRVSQSSLSIFGYLPEDMQGRSVLEFIVADDGDATMKMISGLHRGEVIRDFRNRYWHRDGHQVDMMWSAAWDPESDMLFCVGRNISILVVDERFARDQKDVLGMISAMQPLPEILDNICAMVERRLPGSRASITMVDSDSGTLKVLSAPILPAEYCAIVDGLVLAEGASCCATAAYRGEAIRVDDVAESDLWANYREVALAAKLLSCWCMPMMSKNNAVLGTLSLYCAEKGLPGIDAQVMLTCTQMAALAFERAEDQAQLSASEQRYRSLFTHNPDAVFSFDRTGAFTSMNASGYALTGMTPESLLGTHFAAIVDPAKLTATLENFDRSMAGEPLRYETSIRDADGTLLELDVSNLPVVIDGEVVGIFGIAKDLRAIKAAKRDLERQLEFTQAVTDSLQEGLVAINAQGMIGFANPAASEMLGQRITHAESYLGQWAPLDPAEWLNLPDTGLSGEFELGRKEGKEIRHIAYRVAPLHVVGNGDGWLITLRDRTAEVEAGRALAERDQFFSLSRDLFCMISLKGLFVQLNPAMIEALGYGPGELIGQPYLNFLVAADRPKAEAAMNQLARGQIVERLDLRVRSAAGVVKTLELNSALGDDRIIYVVAREVTAQRDMEKVFEQHRTLFEIAGSIARIGGWIIDLQNNKVILSDEVCAIHQIPPGSVIEMERVVDLYVPECHRELRSKLKSCMAHGEPYELRCQALNAAGERIWVHLMGKALRADDGEITGIQGAVQDISDVVRTENELQRMASRMQNTLDSITDAFFSVDAGWHFTYINQRAEDLLEREAAELLGHNLWEMFPEARSSEIYPRYYQAMASGQSQHFEVYYQGLQRWLDISAYPFEDGLSVYFRDISERKESEQRLHMAMAELERSNRELQDFAFIASHDLQEPLRKVQAFGERLERRADQLDETGRDYLNRMRQASGRMQNLIQDLLSYSRVTTRGGALEVVSLDRVLDGVLADMETTIENAGGTIQRQPLANVQGDVRQLGQLLQNLLSNALKFHRQDESPVIRVYGENGEDGNWTLSVADNGIGFDEKYLDRIFNPFQRLHERQQFTGTGIGLAIVRKIAERHQAGLSARSEPGVGSVFSVTFRETTVVRASTNSSTGSGTPL
ncbi:PAS domain S-box protein [Halopseudomonas sp.]|uniref:PAS domain S-box protein n=1 Tax=Halopseudomonas sp. TaxID=2901191 RepID=UPI003563FDEA